MVAGGYIRVYIRAAASGDSVVSVTTSTRAEKHSSSCDALTVVGFFFLSNRSLAE